MKESLEDLNGPPNPNFSILNVLGLTEYIQQAQIKVTGLHPKVADALSATLNESKARKLSIGMHSGIRLPEFQTSLYAKGRWVKNNDNATKANPMGKTITNAIGLYGWHVLGFAGDLVYKDEKGNWTWNKTQEQWSVLGSVGELFGLEWGGRWAMKDWPHFQMIPKLKGVPIGIMAAVEIAEREGIEALWKML